MYPIRGPRDFSLIIGNSPTTEAYSSAYQLVTSSPSLYSQRYAITREDYLEIGSDISRRRWKGPYSDVPLRVDSRFKE